VWRTLLIVSSLLATTRVRADATAPPSNALSPGVVRYRERRSDRGTTGWMRFPVMKRWELRSVWGQTEVRSPRDDETVARLRRVIEDCLK
jgi:hypothetical protein